MRGDFHIDSSNQTVSRELSASDRLVPSRVGHGNEALFLEHGNWDGSNSSFSILSPKERENPGQN